MVISEPTPVEGT